jgi:YgiT-type zinc finger domain-containing protein
LEFGKPTEAGAMKCVICKHGETKPGKVSVTLQREESTIITKGVPADVCEKCGEYFLSESVREKIYARVEEVVKKGAEVEILRFTA